MNTNLNNPTSEDLTSVPSDELLVVDELINFTSVDITNIGKCYRYTWMEEDFVSQAEGQAMLNVKDKQFDRYINELKTKNIRIVNKRLRRPTGEGYRCNFVKLEDISFIAEYKGKTLRLTTADIKDIHDRNPDKKTHNAEDIKNAIQPLAEEKAIEIITELKTTISKLENNNFKLLDNLTSKDKTLNDLQNDNRVLINEKASSDANLLKANAVVANFDQRLADKESETKDNWKIEKDTLEKIDFTRSFKYKGTIGATLVLLFLLGGYTLLAEKKYALNNHIINSTNSSLESTKVAIAELKTISLNTQSEKDILSEKYIAKEQQIAHLFSQIESIKEINSMDKEKREGELSLLKKKIESLESSQVKIDPDVITQILKNETE